MVKRLSAQDDNSTVTTNAVFVAPALGTPASGVMTNVTGTASGLTAGNVTTNANLTGHVTSTGNAAILGSFTHAQLNTAVSDADIARTSGTNTFTGVQTMTSPAIATPTGIVKGDVGLGNVDNTSNATERAATATLTNKRITPRVVTTTDDATAVIDVDVTDQYQLTAVANATNFSTTGTPVAGQRLMIRFKDAGSAKAITWDGVFRAIGVTLPTTTVISKTHYVGCVYNFTDTKWDVLAVSVEA